MKTEDGLAAARLLKAALLKQGLPIQQVFLFGSVAKGTTHKDSDIDIAVLCLPFAASRHEENLAVRRARWDIDSRISPVCLHPEDMENKYSTLVQEVKRYGIGV